MAGRVGKAEMSQTVQVDRGELGRGISKFRLAARDLHWPISGPFPSRVDIDPAAANNVRGFVGAAKAPVETG